jgi:hypothetical protein
MGTVNGKTLAFGYRGFPDGVRAVWGARLIAPNDLVWDRQDLLFEDDEAREELTSWLNTHALKTALKRLGRIPLSPSSTDEVVIYEDTIGRFVANAQASFGYVYVAAWLLGHAPEGP